MKFLACFPEKAAVQVMSYSPVLDIAPTGLSNSPRYVEQLDNLSREITATATTTAKSCRIGSG